MEMPSHGPLSPKDGNMGVKWDDGTFLGNHRSSNTSFVGTQNGLHMVRSIQRKPMRDRWIAEELSKLKATPWSTRDRPDSDVKFKEASPDDKTATEAVPPPNPRAMRLSMEDFTMFGFTPHCPQCNQMMRYHKTKPGVFHTELCRTRMIRELSTTENGQGRLKKWSEMLIGQYRSVSNLMIARSVLSFHCPRQSTRTRTSLYSGKMRQERQAQKMPGADISTTATSRPLQV